jgi:hypothetical protein
MGINMKVQFSMNKVEDPSATMEIWVPVAKPPTLGQLCSGK